jgi:hypothetical protein
MFIIQFVIFFIFKLSQQIFAWILTMSRWVNMKTHCQYQTNHKNIHLQIELSHRWHHVLVYSKTSGAVQAQTCIWVTPPFLKLAGYLQHMKESKVPVGFLPTAVRGTVFIVRYLNHSATDAHVKELIYFVWLKYLPKVDECAEYKVTATFLHALISADARGYKARSRSARG